MYIGLIYLIAIRVQHSILVSAAMCSCPEHIHFRVSCKAV